MFLQHSPSLSLYHGELDAALCAQRVIQETRASRQSGVAHNDTTHKRAHEKRKEFTRFLIHFSRNFLISQFFFSCVLFFFTLYFYSDRNVQQSQFVLTIGAVKMWKIFSRAHKKKEVNSNKPGEAEQL